MDTGPTTLYTGFPLLRHCGVHHVSRARRFPQEPRIALLRKSDFRHGLLDTKLQKISDSCHWDVVDKSRAKAKAADAALRERVAEYVHPCNQHIEGLGNWCWTDPYGIIDEEGYKNSREKALEEAVEYKKMGLAFKHN